ncbi:UNKNOWN [Stylonychia lemnae]|uniref:Uncharacterized protein n=1 Tax=Stylonychia lemnae TaxID=5949 RepID=A0A078ASJ3_STYLE|nr:UNKNOWN [Stylonychia lemnae]|eukprot:CDW84182.1 UNKNOWN [Stylonychia lemnae]
MKIQSLFSNDLLHNILARSDLHHQAFRQPFFQPYPQTQKIIPAYLSNESEDSGIQCSVHVYLQLDTKFQSLV